MNIKPKDMVLVLVFIFSIVGIVQKDPAWFLVVGLITFLGMITEAPFRMLVPFWEKLSLGLNYVSTRIIFGFIFFVVVTPLGFLNRTTAKNFLHKDNVGDTLFEDRDHTYTAADFERPF